jgi:hypothetical protein
VIISHKYKFIFIKTTKTAGTSLEVFFSGVCGEDDIVTPIFPLVVPHKARNYKEGDFFNHISAREVKEKLPKDIWNSYYKFCFERNPWDKCISYFHMLSKRSENGLNLEQYFTDNKFPKDISKYLENDIEIVDDIFLFEELNSNLTLICNKLGIPFSGSLDVKAKGDYRTDKRHYREQLSTEQSEVIRKKFLHEINRFGYQF